MNLHSIAASARMVLIALVFIVAFPVSATEANSNNTPYKGMVISIHPIYLIAQAVTQEVEQPMRLLDADVDGHSSQLSPKQVKLVQKANFILWMGPNFESAFNKILQKSGNADNAISIGKYIPNPYFARNLRGDVASKIQTRTADKKTFSTQQVNPHIWLDPNKAIAIATFIAKTRSIQYPQYQPMYMANLAKFKQHMLQAVTDIQASRTSLLGNPTVNYLSYVDVFQALEPSINFSLKASYTYEDAAVTAQHMKWINQTIQKQQIDCIVVPKQIAGSLRTPSTISKAIVSENLSSYNNFITGWSATARQLINCAADSRALKH